MGCASLMQARSSASASRLALLLVLLVCAPLLPRALAIAVAEPVVDGDAGAASQAASEGVTVFLCADSGNFSGAHELGGILRAMEGRQELTLKHCQSAHLGIVRHADGHAVRSLAVTTGINYISSTLCTRSVLKLRRERGYTYDAMVFVGTSGFSPIVGGWDPTNTTAYAAFQLSEQEVMLRGDAAINPETPPAPMFKTLRQVRAEATAEAAAQEALSSPAALLATPLPSQLNFEDLRTGVQVDVGGCSPRTVSDSVTPLSLGSVCVTSASFFREAGCCNERPRHTQCSRPHCTGFERGLSSEMKIFFTSDALARRIEAASAGRAWPEMPETVKGGLQRLWAANEAVEPVGEGAARGRTAPTTPTFVKCAEATGNTILFGAERDYLCREHTAYTLNLMREKLRGKQYRDADPQAPPLTAQDVTCVRAMEALGFLRALSDDSTASEIPIAVVRAASNYDMHPMKKVYVPPAVWEAALAAGQLTVSPRVAAALAAEKAAAADGGARSIAAYTWHQNLSVMPEAEYRAFVAASFHYAVRTTTSVVSNYFFGGRDFA